LIYLLEHVTNVHAANITAVTINQTPERKNINNKHRKINTYKHKIAVGLCGIAAVKRISLSHGLQL